MWLGIHDPTEAEMAAIRDNFPVHELAIEDASDEHQRAKMEDYDNHFFVVLRTARYDDDSERVEFGEIHIFAGPGYAISVRHGQGSKLSQARQRLEDRPELLREGPVSVVWAVLDKVVDDYEPVVEGLADDIEDVEVTETMQRYFRDVNDHVKLVHEEVASQRELLTSILEANLAVLGVRQNQISVSQNETTKQLTLVATIFLPLSFITGFFGQNFGWLVNHITSLWVFLVFGVGSLAVSGAILVAWFRRSRYF